MNNPIEDNPIPRLQNVTRLCEVQKLQSELMQYQLMLADEILKQNIHSGEEQERIIELLRNRIKITKTKLILMNVSLVNMWIDW